MKFYSAPLLHTKRVEGITAQIKKWKSDGLKTRLCTARGGWQSISPGMRTYKQHSTQISVNLFDILSLDTEYDSLHAFSPSNPARWLHA